MLLRYMVYLSCAIITTVYFIIAQPFTWPFTLPQWITLIFAYTIIPYPLYKIADIILLQKISSGKRGLLEWTQEKQKEDLENFIEVIRQHSDQELGLLLAIANDFRKKFLEATDIDLHEPQQAICEHPELLFELSECVHEAKQEGDFNTAGSMLLWIHTLRAASLPDLRPLGIELWSELSRGFDSIEESAQHYLSITGITLNIDTAKEIPTIMTREEETN